MNAFRGTSIGLDIRACQGGHRVAFATAAQRVARLADAHPAGTPQTSSSAATSPSAKRTCSRECMCGGAEVSRVRGIVARRSTQVSVGLNKVVGDFADLRISAGTGAFHQFT
jgi:hypothetical protein